MHLSFTCNPEKSVTNNIPYIIFLLFGGGGGGLTYAGYNHAIITAYRCKSQLLANHDDQPPLWILKNRGEIVMKQH